MTNIVASRSQFQAFESHLVPISPWPFLTAFALFFAAIGAVGSFHGLGHMSLDLGLLSTVMAMQLWLRDVVIEGTYIGNHLPKVSHGFTIGFVLFIVSEAFAFLSIFWAYAHSALVPSVELGSSWPPIGIEAIDPFGLPLLNTILLLSSGAVLTVAHHGLVQGSRRLTILGLIWTIVLAVVFTSCQGFEYFQAPFTLADSVYGSVFYGGTAVHGLHVIIGTLFLIVGLWRVINYNVTSSHFIGLEVGILYWHFVDVVWLLLYVVFYYWGGQV